MRRERLCRLILPILVAALAACGDGGTDPGSQPLPGDRLTFVSLAESAPPLETTEVSFWAVRGDNREVEIHFAPQPGDDDDEGEEFLEFRVSGNSLLAFPDGRQFARGDSVLITITVVDPAKFIFEFQPAGLKFSPDDPARLEVSYRWAERDDQGEVVGEDEFGFWKQEHPGALWFRVGTVKLKDLDRARAEITGFSKYALASE